MNKLEKVTLLSTIVFVGFAFAVIYHYILGTYMGFGFPCNTFLSERSTMFSDFTKTINLTANFAPFLKTSFWMNYFPLAYIILFPFTLIKNVIVSYVVFVSGFIFCFAPLNWKFFKCSDLTRVQNLQNVFILSFLSYPFLLILDRGNFDMFLFILFALFIYAFKAEKYMLAAILIGIENACKPFLVLFLVLFLFNKKYKEFFISLILTTVLIIGGFLLLKGGFIHNISTFIINLRLTESFFVYSNKGGSASCSSLFMALKLILCLLYNLISTHLLAEICKYINLITITIVIFFSWKERVFWKQITLLTLAVLVLPYIIFDYKLIFLFVPIWLFVNNSEKSRFDLIYTILFALLLIPKNLPFGIFFNLGFSVVLNPFLMILFIGLIIFEQLQLKSIKENLNE